MNFNQPSKLLFELVEEYYQKTNVCDYCGGNHQSFECQTSNTFSYADSRRMNDLEQLINKISQRSIACEYCGRIHLTHEFQLGNSYFFWFIE